MRIFVRLYRAAWTYIQYRSAAPGERGGNQAMEEGVCMAGWRNLVFSEPQVDTHTVIDLESPKWAALQVSEGGLEIAATCKIIELDQLVEKAPAKWIAPSSSVTAAVLSSPLPLPSVTNLPLTTIVTGGGCHV